MKFVHVFAALAATIAQAQPTEAQVPLAKVEADTAEPSLLQKRSAAVLTVYTSSDCSSGGATITVGGNAKGNFATGQHSVKISSLNDAYHLSLYTATNQGRSLNLRLNSGNVGQCWTYSGDWFSYGAYNY
ncbi:hypothetical protein F4823DRAFT_564656 [Ustulina deusta]|nr:hypothetical protein F4823DRAFT_564656 [Ustulina deusta]